MRWLRCAASFAAVILGIGCNAPQLAYDHLDLLASWRLGKYVDLTKEQEDRADAKFDVLWWWHRKYELPRYVHDLRELAQDAHPLSSAQLASWAQRGDAHWNHTVAELAPAACAELSTLSGAQVQSLLRRLDRNIAKDSDSFVNRPEAAIREESERRLLKMLEGYLGDLDATQRGEVERWSAARELPYSRWLDQRKRWRNQFELALAAPHAPGFCNRVKELFSRPGALSRGELPLRYDPTIESWLHFLAQIGTTLTPGQLQHLRSELRKLAADLETLAADSSR